MVFMENVYLEFAALTIDRAMAGSNSRTPECEHEM